MEEERVTKRGGGKGERGRKRSRKSSLTEGEEAD